MRLKVGLLGGGSWGTTVASVVSRNAPITLWARDVETVDGINTDNENRKYLPGIKLPSGLRATHDMAEVVAGPVSRDGDDGRECRRLAVFIEHDAVDAAAVKTYHRFQSIDGFARLKREFAVRQFPVTQANRFQIGVWREVAHLDGVCRGDDVLDQSRAGLVRPGGCLTRVIRKAVKAQSDGRLLVGKLLGSNSCYENAAADGGAIIECQIQIFDIDVPDFQFPVNVGRLAIDVHKRT